MSPKASPDTLLTPSELAKYLHLTERTVLKLASSEKLPGILIDKKWRFKRNLIDEWLEAQALATEDFQDAPDGMKVPLGDLLTEEGLIHDMQASSPISAIEELAGRAYINRWVRDRDWMVSALIEREGLSSTAMEGGVAFLHTRQRDTGKLTRPFVIVGRSYDGIDFGSPDGKPTFLFFLLGLKYDSLHLPILGRLARIMKTTRTVAKLRATTSPVKMRSILLELDKKALTSALRSPIVGAESVNKPTLDRELRLRAIMRISARKQYEAKKAREEAEKEAAKAAKSAEKKKAKKATTKPAAKKPAAKKAAAAKKPAATKAAAAKKPAAKKATAAKKPAAKKATAAKKPAAKKTTTKKTTTKKPATKKTTAKKKTK